MRDKSSLDKPLYSLFSGEVIALKHQFKSFFCKGKEMYILKKGDVFKYTMGQSTPTQISIPGEEIVAVDCNALNLFFLTEMGALFRYQRWDKTLYQVAQSIKEPISTFAVYHEHLVLLTNKMDAYLSIIHSGEMTRPRKISFTIKGQPIHLFKDIISTEDHLSLIDKAGNVVFYFNRNVGFEPIKLIEKPDEKPIISVCRCYPSKTLMLLKTHQLFLLDEKGTYEHEIILPDTEVPSAIAFVSMRLMGFILTQTGHLYKVTHFSSREGPEVKKIKLLGVSAIHHMIAQEESLLFFDDKNTLYRLPISQKSSLVMPPKRLSFLTKRLNEVPDHANKYSL